MKRHLCGREGECKPTDMSFCAKYWRETAEECAEECVMLRRMVSPAEVAFVKVKLAEQRRRQLDEEVPS